MFSNLRAFGESATPSERPPTTNATRHPKLSEHTGPEASTPSRDRVSQSFPRTRTNQRSSQSSAQWQPDSWAAGRGVSGGPRDSDPTGGGSGHKVPLSVRPGRRPAPPVGTVSHGPPPEREQTSGRSSARHSGSLITGRLGEACRAARGTRALPAWQRLQSAAEREAGPQARTSGRDRVSRSSPRTRTNQRSF
jgi:hypothetical protein